MSRTLLEWIGTNDDSPIPDRVKLRVFLKYDGICQCGCGRRIVTGEPWQADHIVALVNEGRNRESNLHPLLIEHHKNKTRSDVAIKAMTYAKRKRDLGLGKSKRPMPGSRKSPWKRKISGEVVKR